MINLTDNQICVYITGLISERKWSYSMINNSVRFSYPAIFGETLQFTVPADAEGVSLRRSSTVTPLSFRSARSRA